ATTATSTARALERTRITTIHQVLVARLGRLRGRRVVHHALRDAVLADYVSVLAHQPDFLGACRAHHIVGTVAVGDVRVGSIAFAAADRCGLCTPRDELWLNGDRHRRIRPWNETTRITLGLLRRLTIRTARATLEMIRETDPRLARG